MFDANDDGAAELVRRPQHELPAVYLCGVPGLQRGLPRDLVRVQRRSPVRAQRRRYPLELFLAVLTEAGAVYLSKKLESHTPSYRAKRIEQDADRDRHRRRKLFTIIVRSLHVALTDELGVFAEHFDSADEGTSAPSDDRLDGSWGAMPKRIITEARRDGVSKGLLAGALVGGIGGVAELRSRPIVAGFRVCCGGRRQREKTQRERTRQPGECWKEASRLAPREPPATGTRGSGKRVFHPNAVEHLARVEILRK